MKLKKVATTLIMLFLITSISFSFNWDSYKTYTLDQLITAVNSQAENLKKEHKGTVNELFLFNAKYNITVNLEMMPQPIDNEYKDFAENIGSKYFNRPDLFGHQLTINHNSIKCIFLFQSQLVDFMKYEAEVNKNIKLYIIPVTYYYEDKKLIIAVNEFAATEDSGYERIILDGIPLIKIDNKKAFDYFNNVINSYPEYPPAYLFAAFIKFLDNQTEESRVLSRKGMELITDITVLEEYKKMLNKLTSNFKSDKEQTLYNESYDLIENGKPQAALKRLNQAIKLNPYNYKLYFEIGFANIEIKEYKKAIDYLEKARMINPLDEHVLHELQYCYVELNDEDKLLEIINDLSIIGGSEKKLLHELGYFYGKNKNYKKAVDIFESMLKKYPDSYITYYTLGELYLRFIGDKQKAKINFKIFLDNIDKIEDVQNFDKKYFKEKAALYLLECN